MRARLRREPLDDGVLRADDRAQVIARVHLELDALALRLGEPGRHRISLQEYHGSCARGIARRRRQRARARRPLLMDVFLRFSPGVPLVFHRFS